MADEIAIDLGTSYTRIYVSQKKAVIFDEPTCLAIDRESGRITDVGYLAYKALGRTPFGLSIVFPMKDGVVADVNYTSKMIDQVFNNLGKKRLLRGTKYYVSAPNEMTAVEKDALVEVYKRLGAKEIYLEPCGKVAALGAGFDIASPTGTLILDIGGGVSDCAAISMGDIVVSHSTKVGGRAFDHKVERFLKNSKNLSVGPRAAEQVKMRIGSINPKSENSFFEVSGRNIATGLPTTAIVSTYELIPLFRPLVEEIERTVTEVIQDIPSEMVGDIVKSGLILTGGGSNLPGIKEILQDELKIPVRQIQDPSNAVIIGLAKLIES